MDKSTKTKLPTSVKLFSPTDRLVMAFTTDDNAEKARQALLARGFPETDIARYTKEAVIAELGGEEEQAVNPLQVGQDVPKITEYLALAKEECGFLVIHAQKDEESKRAIDISRPYGLKFAEKYNRLTLEELA
jgi:hypothetical protein